MRPLPSLSFTLRAECVKQFTGSGDKTGSVEPKNQPAVKKKISVPHRTAVARVFERWRMASAETGPESRAPRDQSERRHREGGLRCFFSRFLSSNSPPIFDLSLALVSSALRSLHLPSTISPASQLAPVHHTARTADERNQPGPPLAFLVPYANLLGKK